MVGNKSRHKTNVSIKGKYVLVNYTNTTASDLWIDYYLELIYRARFINDLPT